MKAVRVIAIILVTGILVAAGVLWWLDRDPEDVKVVTSDETIALVNLDTGVTYGDRIANYSESFIGSLSGENVERVNAGEAKAGLEDGTYGAVITFPSDLSSRVSRMETLDTNKIQIRYEISKRLHEKREIAVREDVERLFYLFNEELSYAYVKSVLSEVEESQLSVTKVFGNNDNMIGAARNLSMAHYDSEVKFSEMPDIKVDPKSVDFGKFKWLQTDNKYSSEIENAYAGGYKQAYDSVRPDLDQAEDKLMSDIEGAQSDIALIGSWAVTVQGEINTEKGKIRSLADEYQEALDEYADAYAKYVQEKNKKPGTGEGNSGEEIEEPKLEDYVTDELRAKLDKIGSDYTGRPSIEMDKNVISSDLDAINNQIARFDPAVLTGSADSSIQTKINESNNSLNADMKDLKSDFETTQSGNNDQYKKAGDEYDADAKKLAAEALRARIESDIHEKGRRYCRRSA